MTCSRCDGLGLLPDGGVVDFGDIDGLLRGAAARRCDGCKGTGEAVCDFCGEPATILVGSLPVCDVAFLTAETGESCVGVAS